MFDDIFIRLDAILALDGRTDRWTRDKNKVVFVCHGTTNVKVILNPQVYSTQQLISAKCHHDWSTFGRMEAENLFSTHNREVMLMGNDRQEKI